MSYCEAVSRPSAALAGQYPEAPRPNNARPARPIALFERWRPTSAKAVPISEDVHRSVFEILGLYIDFIIDSVFPCPIDGIGEVWLSVAHHVPALPSSLFGSVQNHREVGRGVSAGRRGWELRT